MRKILFIMPLLVVCATVAADNPVDRWAKAVGGREKVAAIKSIYREGRLNMPVSKARLKYGTPQMANFAKKKRSQANP